MKWIMADKVLTMTLYDEEHEDHLQKRMTVEDILDKFTDEGCPTIYSSPAQQWIPCSERLPKARESVILSTKEWTGEGCYWETTKHHVIWKGYRWNATYWDDEVIAWMPLPKPYKEEQDV